MLQTLQKLKTIVQRLHPFHKAATVRNRRITIGHAGFVRGIGLTANVRRQSLGDRNFEESGRRPGHDDARHDLRDTSSQERVNTVMK